MNTKYSKFSPRLIVAAVALSLGLASSAFAVPPKGDVPMGHAAGMFDRHMMHGMQGLSRLHADLKLDAKQEALWQEAEKASKDNMSSMRERFRTHREETASLLNQPGADLRAVLKRMDELRAEGQKQHEATRDRWLAVYDALNPEQKEQARVYFKNKLERMDRGGRRGDGRR